jgi:CheY-like chemotaxis protein
MTAQLRSALRAVVLPSPDVSSQDTPTRRLLNELGHDVTRAESPEHALQLLSSDYTDLLVIDVTNNNENCDLVASLIDLPEEKRPDQVAIFSDSIDAQLRDLHRKISPSHVHVFLKPLHMHGLLNVLRTMERNQSGDKGLSA